MKHCCLCLAVLNDVDYCYVCEFELGEAPSQDLTPERRFAVEGVAAVIFANPDADHYPWGSATADSSWWSPT